MTEDRIVDIVIREAMDASTLNAGINAYTNKSRREALGNSSTLFRGIIADPDNNKREFLFGDKVTKGRPYIKLC